MLIYIVCIDGEPAGLYAANDEDGACRRAREELRPAAGARVTAARLTPSHLQRPAQLFRKRVA